MYLLPYVNALDAFLAVWFYLPQPLTSFISANLFFFSILAVIRRFLRG